MKWKFLDDDDDDDDAGRAGPWYQQFVCVIYKTGLLVSSDIWSDFVMIIFIHQHKR